LKAPDSTEWTSRTAEADTGQPWAQSGSWGVESGRVDLADLGPAEVGGDVAVDGAAVVGHGDRRDRPDLLAPLQPALDQLGDRAGAAAALLAAVELFQELGLDLLGLTPGGLGLPADLAAEPAFAAGEGSRPANTWTWRLPPRFLITLPPSLDVIASGGEE
jgi:hypothetical protein